MIRGDTDDTEKIYEGYTNIKLIPKLKVDGLFDYYEARLYFLRYKEGMNFSDARGLALDGFRLLCKGETITSKGEIIPLSTGVSPELVYKEEFEKTKRSYKKGKVKLKKSERVARDLEESQDTLDKRRDPAEMVVNSGTFKDSNGHEKVSTKRESIEWVAKALGGGYVRPKDAVSRESWGMYVWANANDANKGEFWRQIYPKLLSGGSGTGRGGDSRSSIDPTFDLVEKFESAIADME